MYGPHDYLRRDFLASSQHEAEMAQRAREAAELQGYDYVNQQLLDAQQYGVEMAHQRAMELHNEAIMQREAEQQHLLAQARSAAWQAVGGAQPVVPVYQAQEPQAGARAGGVQESNHLPPPQAPAAPSAEVGSRSDASSASAMSVGVILALLLSAMYVCGPFVVMYSVVLGGHASGSIHHAWQDVAALVCLCWLASSFVAVPGIFFGLARWRQPTK
jgi:hypothetical protein